MVVVVVADEQCFTEWKPAVDGDGEEGVIMKRDEDKEDGGSSWFVCLPPSTNTRDRVAFASANIRLEATTIVSASWPIHQTFLSPQKNSGGVDIYSLGPVGNVFHFNRPCTSPPHGSSCRTNPSSSAHNNIR